MHLTVISNSDQTQSDLYKIARVVYAETHGQSLRGVEALSSMIWNYACISGLRPVEVADEVDIFESLNPASLNHAYLSVDAARREFQMCLRVVKKMMNGNLKDACFGATRFHRVDQMPMWAMARGYIAEIDGLLFYL